MRRRPLAHGVALGLVLTPLPLTDLALVLLTLPLVGLVLDGLIAQAARPSAVEAAPR